MALNRATRPLERVNTAVNRGSSSALTTTRSWMRAGSPVSGQLTQPTVFSYVPVTVAETRHAVSFSPAPAPAAAAAGRSAATASAATHRIRRGMRAV